MDTVIFPNQGDSMEAGPSSELRVLLCAARIETGKPSPGSIASLLAGDVDWQHLVQLASRHRVFPLLAWTLPNYAPDRIPSSWRTVFRECLERTAARNESLVRELSRILGILKSQRIPAVPFGEPVAAVRLYHNLALRRSSGMDILIPRENILRARELLQGDRYIPTDIHKGASDATRLRFLCVSSLQRPKDRMYVRIYWQVVPLSHQQSSGNFSVPLDYNLLSNQLDSIQLNDAVWPAFSKGDLFTVLCVEAASGPPGLLRIMEIAKLLSTAQRLDWEKIKKRAAQLGAWRRILFACHLASELLGAPLPESVRADLEADATAMELAGEARARILTGRTGPVSRGGQRHFDLQVREKFRDRLKFLFGQITSPTEEELSLLSLPDVLSPLYRPLKCGRLLGKRLGMVTVGKMAVFMPTPPEVIDRILMLARVTPADTVYDLGCGDGRLVIAAAKRCGARGVGIELDPKLVALAQANANREGVANRVSFFEQNALETDLSPASVIILFLSPSANLMLRPKIERCSRVRVVSYIHEMGDWPPTKSEFVLHDGGADWIHLWEAGSASQPARLNARDATKR